MCQSVANQFLLHLGIVVSIECRLRCSKLSSCLLGFFISLCIGFEDAFVLITDFAAGAMSLGFDKVDAVEITFAKSLPTFGKSVMRIILVRSPL